MTHGITEQLFTLDTHQIEETFVLNRHVLPETTLEPGMYRVICGELVRIIPGIPNINA